MLPFRIRDILWLTAVVGLAVGWAIDHRWQSAATAYYRDAHEYWRESVQRTDDMLADGFGFEIKHDGTSKSYIPPAGLSLNPNWPAAAP